MLAIQSDIAKYYSLYIMGAAAFQTPSVFFTYPVLKQNMDKKVQFSAKSKIK